MYPVFRPGHQFQLLWSLVYGTLGKIQCKFFLRLSFHLHVIVIRIERDKLGNGLVPVRAQHMRGPISHVCHFLCFYRLHGSSVYRFKHIFLTMATYTEQLFSKCYGIFRRAKERKVRWGDWSRFQRRVGCAFSAPCYMLLSLQDLITVIA